MKTSFMTVTDYKSTINRFRYRYSLKYVQKTSFQNKNSLRKKIVFYKVAVLWCLNHNVTKNEARIRPFKVENLHVAKRKASY